MAEPTKRQPINILDEWLDECMTYSHRLTKWELSFIESLQDQRDNGRFLSEKQENILDRIRTEKVP